MPYPKYEVDHIIPVSKGGKHIIYNLQYLTKSENRRKSRKIFNEKNEFVPSCDHWKYDLIDGKVKRIL